MERFKYGWVVGLFMRRQAQEVILNCSVFRLDSKDPNDIAVVQLSEGKDEYEPIKFSVGILLLVIVGAIVLAMLTGMFKNHDEGGR